MFGLVALLIGTGLLWLVGWILSLGGLLLKAIAGLLWLLLRFVVPVAIVAGLVYFIVKALQDRSESRPQVGAAAPVPSGPGTHASPSVPAGSPSPVSSTPFSPAAPAPAAAKGEMRNEAPPVDADSGLQGGAAGQVSGTSTLDATETGTADSASEDNTAEEQGNEPD